MEQAPASISALKASTNIADLPSYQLVPALAAVFSDPDVSLQRGLFQRITAHKIDLPSSCPPPKPEHADLWIKRLPQHTRNLFKNATNALQESLIDYITSAKKSGPLPQARLYASDKEYAALIGKAEDAGMIHWSLVSEEDSQYSALATDIEMTLFAVSKSGDRSRLISWPRIQNEAMPPPPYASLPNPSMFESIRMHGASPGAFFLDISNMFHNITLPLWLSRLLPMKPIRLSSLPISTQQRITKRTIIPHDASDIIVRPCQAKMPMGFKWAVYIAHTFVSSCFDEAFRLLKSSKLAIPNMKLSKLRAEETPFLISKCSPLLLHIIDDAACITIDWPPELVSAWHRLIRGVLRFKRLPVAERKYSNPQAVIADSISFIGCNWDLAQGIITPLPQKLERTTACVTNLLQSQSWTCKEWERVVGKLLWFATLNRPLLSCAQNLFHASKTKPSLLSISQVQACRRELRTLTTFLLLARVDVNLPICHIVVAFDASRLAGAVTYAYVPAHTATRLWSAAQAARFSRDSNDHDQLDEVAHVVKYCQWKLAFIHYWRKEEHINCLEAATAVLAAEWLSRSQLANIRVIFLTDSLVTLGELQKGRSSKTGLLLRCRRFAAILLAHELRATIAFVRSGMNPADKFTRIPKQEPSDANAELATN